VYFTSEEQKAPFLDSNVFEDFESQNRRSEVVTNPNLDYERERLKSLLSSFFGMFCRIDSLQDLQESHILFQISTQKLSKGNKMPETAFSKSIRLA